MSDVLLYNSHPLAIYTFVAVCPSLNTVGALEIYKHKFKTIKTLLATEETIETVTVCIKCSGAVTLSLSRQGSCVYGTDIRFHASWI
jgi:hypothetical protein